VVKTLKVLLVADEYFSWGVYGGFGYFTRKLARELLKKNVEVEVIVQRISNLQKPIGETELIDGVPVTTLPRKKLSKIKQKKLYETDADIIHSQCGMYDTYLTFKRNRGKAKIITVQDLRTKEETDSYAHLEKTSGYPWYKRLWARYVRSCFNKAMKNADVVACHARLLFPKVKKIFNVESSIMLPNFIDVPQGSIKKSNKPSVVWLARLDAIKQPELCFKLAEDTPDVDFYILGDAHKAYKRTVERLIQRYKGAKNLHLLGFQSGEVKETILSKSWILINTSAYECLPVSFLEALAHKCAILSTRNPDDYTVNFGAWCSTDNLKNGLKWLLDNDRWRELGEKGYEQAKSIHSTEKGIEAHINLYRKLLE